MKARLIRGRSRQSRLILAGRHLHLFVFAPETGADGFGLTLRVRRSYGWLNTRLVLWQRNAAKATRWKRQTRRESMRVFWRPTVTAFEVAQWRTGRDGKTRLGLKRYVRVKVGPGGRTEPL